MAFTMPTLMSHQVTMKNFIVGHPFCGVWLDIGGAKTLTTLAALAEVRPSGHILVIAPLSIARSSWLAEIKKWGFPLRTKSLIVDDNDKRLTTAQRHEIYDGFFTDMPTMYFINQDLIKNLVDSMPTKRYGGQSQIMWPFPTVIVDESQEFKNPTSVRFKALKKVRGAILRMIQLTGSPAPQSLMDVWSQMYLLDEGLALGVRFTAFREKYFQPKQYVNGRPVSWQILPGADETIHQRINHLVLSAENATIPMPTPLPPEVIPITMDDDTKAAYKDFKRDQVIELATPDPTDPNTLIITADNAAILRGKLLQFASGTLYTGDNHDTDFTQIHTQKLLKLESFAADAAAAGDTLLVPYRYRSDARIVPAHLNDRGYPTEVFDGSRRMIERWNAQEIPVMLLQPASHGRGLNLQAGGHELVWYSLPDSLEQWLQTIGRLLRIGQPHDVRVRSLVTLGTIDAFQPQLLQRKKITQDALLEAVREEVAALLDDLSLA
jgi:SNF2 family DNA or RNA helicase